MALSRIASMAAVIAGGALLFHSRDHNAISNASTGQVKPISRPPVVRTLSSAFHPTPAAPARLDTPAAAHAPALADLSRSSVGHWQLAWGSHSVSRLYGARLPLRGAPADAGGEFLARYGALIGISPDDARLEQIRTIEGNIQIIYSQELDGLPVFGSRVNMVLDSENNLIYLSSLVFDGRVPPRDAVSAHVAARAAVDGLGDYSRRRLLEDPGISVEEMQSHARLGYRLMGGTIGLVYEFSVASRVPPLDLEIYIDGMSGEVADIRSLLKK